MSTNRQQRKLEKIIAMAQELLADMQKTVLLNGECHFARMAASRCDAANRGRSQEDEG